MELYKLIDGRILELPRPLNALHDGVSVSNLDLIYRCDLELANDNGWYELIKTTSPSRDGYYYTPSYNLVNNKIIQGWDEHVIESQEDI